MKNYTKILIALFAITAILSLSSCNEEDSIVDNKTWPQYQNTGIVSSILTSYPLEVTSPQALEINDGLIRIDGIVIDRDKLGYGPLGYALSRLNLTSDQISAIQALAIAYKDCITAATSEIKAQEVTIMEKLKAEINAILEQVKAGTLDKSQAREQIKSLRDAAKAEIDAIPGRDAAKAAALECFNTYNSSVRGLLTSEQITKLDEIIANKGLDKDNSYGKGKDKDGKKDGKKGEDKGKKGSFEGDLGKILNKLNLDSEQVTKITNYQNEYKDCYQTAMLPIKTAETVIIETLKATREQILSDLKAGNIDNATAKIKLEEAEKTAKDAMANIPGRADAEAAALKCYNTLLSNIKAILNSEQLLKFEELLAKVPIKTRS